MIKIIQGTYGYKDSKGDIVPKTSKDKPFKLQKEQEERLVKRGVAVYVAEKEEEEIAEKTEVIGNITREMLEAMNHNDLKSFASQHNISASGKKTELINRILNELMEKDDEQPPTITASVPE